MAEERESRPVEVAPGDQIGKFRVERILGRGGMGVVVEATNAQLDLRVALKLLAAGGSSPEAVETLLREARAAVRLKSDHVARVQDVGVDPVHGPYIVMELLSGSTLAEVLAEPPHRLSVQRAVEYVIDTCEGLAEAHVRGIVHQDIKPANLFLATGNDGRPTVKILDFGIAKVRLENALGADGAIDLRVSKQGVALGTPFYLAPEQLRAEQSVDHRADVWALGCVLFELLTGQKAFVSARFTELVVKILEAPRAPVPDDIVVDPGVLAVIDRCLQKAPEKRYASTGELALALLPFARRRAHSVTTRAVTRVRDGGLDPHLSMPSSMPPRPSQGALDLVSSQSLRSPPVPRFDEPVTAPPPPASLKRPLMALAVAVVTALVAVLALMTGAKKNDDPSAIKVAPSAELAVRDVHAPSAPGAMVAPSAPDLSEGMPRSAGSDASAPAASSAPSLPASNARLPAAAAAPAPWSPRTPASAAAAPRASAVEAPRPADTEIRTTR